MPTATREASGKRMPEDEPTPDAVAGIPACVAGNEQSKFPTSTPSTLLGLLLLELEQNTARIRGELPGWYPLRLVPLLEDVRSTVRRADCRLDQLDARAAQLTEVLRERPETEHIARVLERATTSPDRAMRPMSELPDTISLPDRVRNECEVLAQKIIQALKEPDRAPSGERTTGTSADPAPGNRRP